MSRSGDEMINELSKILGGGLEKTASVEIGEEEKKTAYATADVIKSLSKIANELDEAGAEEVANLVDEALKVIINKIQK